MNKFINVGLAVLVFGTMGVELYNLGELNQRATEAKTRSEMEARDAALKAALAPVERVEPAKPSAGGGCVPSEAKKLGISCNADGTADWSNLLAPIPGGGGGSGYVGASAGYVPYVPPPMPVSAPLVVPPPLFSTPSYVAPHRESPMRFEAHTLGYENVIRGTITPSE